MNCEQNIEIGIWCDDAPKLVLTKEYLDTLKEMGIDIFSVMLNSSKNSEPWKLLWKLEQLEKLADELKQRNIKLGITKWVRPNKEELELSMKGNGRNTGLIEICQKIKPSRVEDDGESNRQPKYLKGFKNFKEESIYFLDKNRELCDIADNAELAFTTHTGHWEMKPNKAIYSKMVDINFFQYYAVENRKFNGVETKIDWNDKNNGPGYLQEKHIPAAVLIGREDGPEVGAGFPMYDQRFDGHKPEESYMKQYTAARKFHIRKIMNWSSKWILGKFKQEWAIKCLKDLKNG